jgi:hypothetical protein
MARPTGIVIGLHPAKSHCTNLHNNFGQSAFQISEAIVLVRTINVYPQTVFLGDDDDRLGIASQFHRFRRETSSLLLP